MAWYFVNNGTTYTYNVNVFLWHPCFKQFFGRTGVIETTTINNIRKFGPVIQTRIRVSSLREPAAISLTAII